MNPEGGRRSNGTKIIMSSNVKAGNDRWYVKRFEDLSYDV